MWKGDRISYNKDTALENETVFTDASFVGEHDNCAYYKLVRGKNYGYPSNPQASVMYDTWGRDWIETVTWTRGGYERIVTGLTRNAYPDDGRQGAKFYKYEGIE